MKNQIKNQEIVMVDEFVQTETSIGSQGSHHSSPESDKSFKSNKSTEKMHDKAQQYLAQIDAKIEKLEASEKSEEQGEAQKMNHVIHEILELIDSSTHDLHSLRMAINQCNQDPKSVVIFLENFYHSWALNKEKHALHFEYVLKYAYSNAQENSYTDTTHLLGELYPDYHLQDSIENL